jgi:hypothetical protein
MILYVNGDSHTAAAEAVTSCAWAQDDPLLLHLGQKPHPYNAAVSWASYLAAALGMDLINDSQSGASNHRIMRTAKQWLAKRVSPEPVLMIIQWSTWERQEWLYQGRYIQVTASGQDSVPEDLRDRYRQFVSEVDWTAVTESWHDTIWQWHQDLLRQNIAHVFFNGNNDFSKISQPRDWSGHYLSPYDPAQSFSGLLTSWGHRTVKPGSWHFGPTSHRVWSEIMLQYLLDNNMVDRDAISID